MAVYRRGGIWWYEFQFRCQRLRESSFSSNKAVAQRVERERRRALELGTSGLKELHQPTIFSSAARKWHETSKSRWSANNARIEETNMNRLLEHFGRMLMSDISADDVSRYQTHRKRHGASPKTINLETGTLRAILRKNRLWANIQPDVRMLRVRTDVGRALSADEQHRLLTACKASRSRSLYPAVVLSLHTGMRNGELRMVRWRQVDLLSKEVLTGKGKTAGGDDRAIPLSETAWRTLKEWRTNFPEATPEHFVFPSERYGLAGNEGRMEGVSQPYLINPEIPISSWKAAWTRARATAKVSCRWHDMRHTFVSRMAEGQASDATIMALSGHLSRKMMERYSHVRGEAKRSAIAVLDMPLIHSPAPQGPHKIAHSKELPIT
jgi:integrase